VGRNRRAAGDFASGRCVVISIVRQVRKNFNYHLQVADIKRFGGRHGRIPRGSVVFVRSTGRSAGPIPRSPR
jgi:hypothetical protein